AGGRRDSSRQRRTQPDLGNTTAKSFAWKRVNRKLHLCALRNRPDIRLIDLGDYLHLAQIIGNKEEGGSLQAGCDRLTDIYIALNHHPIDRGSDASVVKIDVRHP